MEDTQKASPERKVPADRSSRAIYLRRKAARVLVSAQWQEQEIAVALNVTPVTVRNYLRRGHKALDAKPAGNAGQE